eukprot:CAMPEP_0174927860 /NCGR_PEP_ID=MMETSP1355-20121228/21701_1 /TAXON_ID=464990 /ORGANISM="Hemiselmis tepida, Strain CCMP443" /LENGTH=78 /DNA_ID=CAMNT_0016173993 /DNA_START=26 /DNA_END=262 /DNA_ORIENTATION=+
MFALVQRTQQLFLGPIDVSGGSKYFTTGSKAFWPGKADYPHFGEEAKGHMAMGDASTLPGSVMLPSKGLDTTPYYSLS